jgi:hypothetical protein
LLVFEEEHTIRAAVLAALEGRAPSVPAKQWTSLESQQRFLEDQQYYADATMKPAPGLSRAEVMKSSVLSRLLRDCA